MAGTTCRTANNQVKDLAFPLRGALRKGARYGVPKRWERPEAFPTYAWRALRVRAERPCGAGVTREERSAKVKRPSQWNETGVFKG